VDGAIDVMLMSVHAGDRKGGAIDVFLHAFIFHLIHKVYCLSACIVENCIYFIIIGGV
jgi:hypothetical protein